MSATASRVRRPWLKNGERLRALLRSPVFAVAALSSGFIAVTALWLSADARIPDFDYGRHVGIAVSYWDELDRGYQMSWFRAFFGYPPLAYLAGAVSAGVGHPGPEPMTLTQNIVFVPALVTGCYLTGRVAYGHMAGVLAGVFALGTPMLLDQFHEFMLDAPAAAMAALAVGLLLVSQRFADWRWSVAAGLATGLALLTKTPAFFFIAGPVAVMLLRGGWRNWRGVLAFGIVALVVAGPWYLRHIDQLRGLAEGASGTVTVATESPITPRRFSLDNFAWYFWSSLNISVLAPLMLFFVAGTVASVVRFVRVRRPDDYTPELLAGAIVGWAGISWITLKDPRYALPLTVFMAVLGTGWITHLRPRPRRILAAAVVLVALVNLVGVSAGVGEPKRWAIGGNAVEGGIWERYVTVYSPQGYLMGGPRDDDRIVGMFEAARRQGVRGIGYETGGPLHFNHSGVHAVIRGLGMLPTLDHHKLAPTDAIVAARTPEQSATLLDWNKRRGRPKPCATIDGVGIYWVRPPPPKDGHNILFCPR